MKTWTLVWFLVFPPNDSGQVEWELHTAEAATQGQCLGHEIYCKGPDVGPVGEGE
jgi:hypothetical protein